jgi:iron complex transport system ATP-binding protein
MAASNAAIEAVHVSADYGREPVLADVSISAWPGELVALIGPNGSGKSTLIRCCSRTLAPKQGEVRLLGEDVRQMSAKESARRVAVVPQSEEQVFDFSVREVVAMGRFAWDDRGQAEVEAAMGATSTLELADRPVNQLSGGERQRVLLARALAQTTPILLLDEPTAQMDVGYQIATLSLLLRLASEGKTVIAALHDLNLVSGFATRAVLLHGGRIAAEGSPESVLNSSEIDAVYGAAFRRIQDAHTGRLVLVPEVFPPAAKASAPKRVHVIGGGGTAAALLSKLWQLGHTLSLGITQPGDSDCEAAHRLGIPTAAAPPFTDFSDADVASAKQLAADATIVVLCSAPYGHGNVQNLKLATDLLELGKRLLVMRRSGERWDYTDGTAEAMVKALLVDGALEVDDPTAEIEKT